MKIDDQTKVQIALAGLQERYRAMHTMRQRVENVCLWVLGIFVVVAGWIVQGSIQLSPAEKGFLCVALIASVIVVRCLYLRDIENGFREQLRVAARIEQVLGFYEKGHFESAETALYPEEWSRAGTESGKGNYFRWSYSLVYTGAVILFAAIILQDCVL